MSAVDELRAEAAELYRLLLDTTAERDALSARLQAVRDAVSEIRGERDRCKISADGWFGDGADPAKDYAVGALDGLDKALGWLERALDASLGTPGDEKPSFVHTLSSGVTATGLPDELPPDLAAEVDRQLDAIDEARARAAASAANYIVRGGSPGDETATARLCDERGMTEYRRPGNPYPCTGSMHVGPDEVVRCDNPIHFTVSPVESSGEPS